jgi:NUMOD3 motif
LIAYTYLIGWSQHNKWYYGARYSSTCHPDDLWVSYFTSSDKVRQFRENYGEPDVIKVRKTFKTAEETIKWENKVLRRMKVIHKQNWLNITDRFGLPAMPGEKNPMYGKRFTEEHKQKISQKMKGIIPWNKGKSGVYSEETLKKFSQKSRGHKRRLGIRHTPETIEKMKKPKTKTHILNLSLAKQGQNDGRKWYNDGINEKFCREIPAKGWLLGRIYRPRHRAKRVV